MIKLIQNDCELISRHFPQLNCELKKQRIWGTLIFSCHYDQSNELLEFKTGENAITDVYEIEIDFNKQYLRLPKTYERSGIIAAHAQTQNIRLIDLHMFSDHSCCLGIYPEEENISVFEFLTQRVIPYFYWQSHFRLYGTEPWAAYSHGKTGFQEKCDELAKLIEKEAGNMANATLSSIGALRNHPCNCGSGKKYKKCCMDTDNSLRSKVKSLQETKNIVEKWVSNCASKQPEESANE